MFTIDVPLDQAREALTLARAQLTIRVVQLSQCRVCGADLERFEQALGTVREILTQLEPAPHGIRPREE
jgi:uncharacterized protein YwbE